MKNGAESERRPFGIMKVGGEVDGKPLYDVTRVTLANTIDNTPPSYHLQRQLIKRKRLLSKDEWEVIQLRHLVPALWIEGEYDETTRKREKDRVEEFASYAEYRKAWKNRRPTTRLWLLTKGFKRGIDKGSSGEERVMKVVEEGKRQPTIDEQARPIIEIMKAINAGKHVRKEGLHEPIDE